MTHQGSLPSSLHPVEGCDLPSSGQANERGGEILIFLTDEDRKRRKRLLKVMTKLKGPRHQVTLSQRADNKLYLLAAAMTLAQLVKIMLARDS